MFNTLAVFSILLCLSYLLFSISIWYRSSALLGTRWEMESLWVLWHLPFPTHICDSNLMLSWGPDTVHLSQRDSSSPQSGFQNRHTSLAFCEWSANGGCAFCHAHITPTYINWLVFKANTRVSEGFSELSLCFCVFFVKCPTLNDAIALTMLNQFLLV